MDADGNESYQPDGDPDDGAPTAEQGTDKKCSEPASARLYRAAAAAKATRAQAAHSVSQDLLPRDSAVVSKKPPQGVHSYDSAIPGRLASLNRAAGQS